jgi:hypothetical protein
MAIDQYGSHKATVGNSLSNPIRSSLLFFVPPFVFFVSFVVRSR